MPSGPQSLQLASLYPELLIHIFSFINPVSLLLVSHDFCDIAIRLLHTDLRFDSIRKLRLFSHGTPFKLTRSPRSFSVELPGGSADPMIWPYLLDAFQKCNNWNKNEALEDANVKDWNRDEAGRLILDLVHFRMNSQSRDPTIGLVSGALSLVNPKTFIWIGPDPDHQFSTAIVPIATLQIFKAVSTWSRITHITLTKVSFFIYPASLPTFSAALPTTTQSIYPYAFPRLALPPSLRELHVSQASFLPPSLIAHTVLTAPALTELRLVDAYSESIWGLRIRRDDIEAQVHSIITTPTMYVEEDEWKIESRSEHDTTEAELIERIRRVVKCERRTERIVGGDRADLE